MMENPIKVNIWGYPYFRKSPTYLHFVSFLVHFFSAPEECSRFSQVGNLHHFGASKVGIKGANGAPSDLILASKGAGAEDSGL